MTCALRRQIQELGESVPIYSQEGRDQLWRNVATELSHRQSAGLRQRGTRRRAMWLLSVVACAVLFVIGLPLFNHGYLLRTEMLEAAARSDRGIVFSSAAGANHTGSDYSWVAGNAEYDLWLHVDGMRFLIRHKASGQTWSTSPDVRDARVPASQLGRLSSPFSIRYGDAMGRVEGWANPYDDATLIEYYHISSGIGIRYLFEDLRIAVRIDYRLGDGFLEVRIPENGIETYGSYEVKAIELFPFFQVRDGAAGNRLILAGSGEEAVDAALHERLKSQVMFGVTGDQFGFLAEVVEGGEYASIHVDPSGLMVPAQRVYVEFLLEGDAAHAPKVHPTVRYHALVEDAGTGSVAELLQQHLRDARSRSRTAGAALVAG